MPRSVYTPAGPKTVTARTIAKADGVAHVITARYVYSPAGPKLVFPSSGGPTFTAAISGPASQSVTSGANTTLVYSVAESGSPVAPLSYAWTVSSSDSHVQAQITQGQGSSTIDLKVIGESTGTAVVTVNCTVTDATGAVASTSEALNVTVPAAGGGGSGSSGPPYSVAIANSNASGDMGNIPTGVTRTETLTAELEQGYAALDPPFTYAWSLAITGNGVTGSISGSGASVTLSLTGATVGNATTWKVTLTTTDASGVVESGILTGGVNTTAS